MGGYSVLGYKIAKGGGSNPGDLGEDLRNQKGANLIPGKAKAENKNPTGTNLSESTPSNDSSGEKNKKIGG